jgi:hypothetical protein
MNGTDQKKLIIAGYTLLRKDDKPTPRIKIRSAKNFEWQTFEKDFASKAARDRRMAELLQSSTTLED